MKIPRPLGITFLALKGDKERLYKSLSKKFLQGEFPYKGGSLSMVEFSLKFHIPLKYVHDQVRDGIQEETLIGGKDIQQQLESIRLKLLDNTLYNYGASNAHLHKLIGYLSQRVYRSDNTHPSLIRELNVALGTSFKGTDSVSKIISLLNETLSSTVPISSSEEPILSSNEILKILGKLSPDMDSMLQEVQETPLLKPVGTAGGVSTVPLKKVQGEYIKKPAIDRLEIPSELLSIPV